MLFMGQGYRGVHYTTRRVMSFVRVTVVKTIMGSYFLQVFFYRGHEMGLVILYQLGGVMLDGRFVGIFVCDIIWGTFSIRVGCFGLFVTIRFV